MDANIRTVAVGMMHCPFLWRQNELLLAGQVELDPRQVALPHERADVIDAPLRVPTAVEHGQLEANLLPRDFDAALFIDPFGHLTECLQQVVLVELGFLRHSEIQILGKPIRLEVAFLQARSALEDPAFRKLGIRGNAGQQPTEDVVLFDDVQIQRKLAGQF